MTRNAVVTVPPKNPAPLLARLAERIGVHVDELETTLRQTAFRNAAEMTNAQFHAVCFVAEHYRLNPITRELYAFPDRDKGVVPVVSVDGWARIINEHPQFDGMEFVEADVLDGNAPTWIECIIYRKDRTHPTRIREYFRECRRDTGPWKSHPRRMLRHKAMIQCARIAFGFSGIYEPDEGERIILGETVVPAAGADAIANINKAIAPPPPVAKIPTSEKADDTRPPLALKGEAPSTPPTFATVMEIVNRARAARDVDELALAQDFASHVANEQQRAELDVEIRAAYNTIRTGQASEAGVRG